jgi:hypothetical protein
MMPKAWILLLFCFGQHLSISDKFRIGEYRRQWWESLEELS